MRFLIFVMLMVACVDAGEESNEPLCNRPKCLDLFFQSGDHTSAVLCHTHDEELHPVKWHRFGQLLDIECAGENEIKVCRTAENGYGSQCERVRTDCDYSVVEFRDHTNSITCIRNHKSNQFAWEMLPVFLREKMKEHGY